MSTYKERKGTAVKVKSEVGFFRQEQVVEIQSVVEVKVDDLVNLVFGAGLYTLPWWGVISFADASGEIGFDEIDNGKFDANTLSFSVEFWNEDDGGVVSTDKGAGFSTKVITLAELVNTIGKNQEFANLVATEEVDAYVADAILQTAIYGKVVWG